MFEGDKMIYKLFIDKEFKKIINSKDIENYIDKKYGKFWNYTIDYINKIIVLKIKTPFYISE